MGGSLDLALSALWACSATAIVHLFKLFVKRGGWHSSPASKPGATCHHFCVELSQADRTEDRKAHSRKRTTHGTEKRAGAETTGTEADSPAYRSREAAGAER